MPVGDIHEAKVVCYCNPQIGLNILYFRISASTAPEPTEAEIGTRIDELLAPLYKGCLAPTASYRGLYIRRVNPPSLAAPIVINPSSGAGTLGTSVCPTQVSGLITWYTGFMGRAFRGRAYIPFPPVEGVNTTGTPNATYHTPLTALATAIASGIVVTGAGGGVCTLSVGVYHRGTNTITDASSWVAHYRFANQYRRSDFGHQNAQPF